MSETMRKRLERSNYVFSGLKTFHELNEAFPSLLDENGNRKTFERFLNDVRKIDETYNSNYLRAEFTFVQASAEMAAKWERFMQDGDRYYLQYRTAGDAKVRPTHAEMAGITLPASDPFWAEFYPPNGWGCRCSVVQVRKSKYPPTDHEEAMARGKSALEVDKKGMFRFNAGMEQKTMPDYNPYTIKRCKLVDLLGRREQDDRDVRGQLALLDELDERQAVGLLGEGVADDDVGVHLLEQLDHLGFARRHFDVVVRGEKLGHEIHDLRIVVDDEHRPAVFVEREFAPRHGRQGQSVFFGRGHDVVCGRGVFGRDFQLRQQYGEGRLRVGSAFDLDFALHADHDAVADRQTQVALKRETALALAFEIVEYAVASAVSRFRATCVWRSATASWSACRAKSRSKALPTRRRPSPYCCRN